MAVVPVALTRAPFTPADARRAGLSSTQLRGASWRRIGAGLYVWAELACSTEMLLASVRRRLPTEAAFSGQTAAWLHGLDLPPCDPIEATVPDGCGVSARAGISVRRASLGDDDVVTRRGLPATSALRTAVDLGSRQPLTEAVVALDMALYRRLVSLDELREHVEAHPHGKGIARLRQAIDLAEPAAESPMETRLRMLLVLAGLPRPQTQVALHDEAGHFVGRPDLYYPDRRLGLEYDGSTHRDSLADDNRRQNRLVNAGYRLLRFTVADIRKTPESTAKQVRAALT